MASEHYTLTSVAGNFVFDKDTPLSHAKLIRDTIVASFRRTLSATIPRIRADKPHQAPKWIRNYLEGPVGKAGYTFEWIPPSRRIVNHIVELPDGRYVIS